MNPLVSVIIPAYNSEKYLGGAISSALSQTYQNLEIVVIDDGSTDGSLAVAKAFNDNRVEVFHQENKGASAARNRGLKEAGGEYIQYLDADDLISPNKIKDQISLLQANPGYICTSGTVHFFENEDHLKEKVQHNWICDGSDAPADFLIKLYGGALIGPQYGGMIAVHSWLCPRSILDTAGKWNEELSVDDDGEYFCRVILASKGIKYSFDGINYYRKFNSYKNLSAQKTYDAYAKHLQATILKARYLTAKTDDPKAKTALSRLFWDNAFNFYPQFMDLSINAEKKAKELTPGLKFRPYRNGLIALIAQIFGWKMVKRLQYLKQKVDETNS